MQNRTLFPVENKMVAGIHKVFLDPPPLYAPAILAGFSNDLDVTKH
jgi:hypothetical protein